MLRLRLETTIRYIKALDTFKKGDACIIFTPDDTHFSIALEAIRRGMHVLIAKPMVKTLEQHLTLAGMAKKHNVLVMCEVHKRFDPLFVNLQLLALSTSWRTHSFRRTLFGVVVRVHC